MDSMELRRNAIVSLINERGSVSFGDLKESFPQVSEMTLRTDLKALDKAGSIVRIHGGAKSVGTVQSVISKDDFLNKRSILNIDEKQIIAQKAIQLLQPEETIFLDSGSTATMMAEQGDVILVAGKGHEDYQEVKGVKHHFDDREELRAAFGDA